MDPGQMFTREVSLTVPPDAPVDSGYQLLVRAGFHPGLTAFEDGFTFDIVSPGPIASP